MYNRHIIILCEPPANIESLGGSQPYIQQVFTGIFLSKKERKRSQKSKVRKNEYHKTHGTRAVNRDSLNLCVYGDEKEDWTEGPEPTKRLNLCVYGDEKLIGDE